MIHGATANIAGRAASSIERGMNRELAHGPLSEFYSVITGSNVQSASVTNTTSNASQQRQPELRHRLDPARAETAPRCRERPQSSPER